MALTIYNNPRNRIIINNAYTLCKYYCNRLSSKVITLEVSKLDVIDDFTSNLVHRKSLNWENFKLKKARTLTCSLLRPISIDITLDKLSQEELDQQFLQMIHYGTEKNILEFITKCQEFGVCPSYIHMLTLLNANSRNANIKVIMELKRLCEGFKDINAIYEANGKFDDYLAEAHWVKGGIVKALHVFENVYENKPSLRRRLRMLLKCLIAELTTHSEAILVSIIKFSERLYEKYNDPFPLTCVWQACFTSEWFSDQKLALELLENNKGLCEAVVGTLPFVVTASLKKHQVEVVYRLLELLIKYEMKTQYSAILVSLFNYKFYMGDLKSCSEIIQWSVTYNVTLPKVVHERFLMLLLNRKNIDDFIPSKPPDPKVELKF